MLRKLILGHFVKTVANKLILFKVYGAHFEKRSWSQLISDRLRFPACELKCKVKVVMLYDEMLARELFLEISQSHRAALPKLG